LDARGYGKQGQEFFFEGGVHGGVWVVCGRACNCSMFI
jgi:hypothetical protein